jgi:histone acetyltransferase (RNA polymerase elongator complex component)
MSSILFDYMLLMDYLYGFQNEDVNPENLSVYPTLVVTREELSVYFERTKMCNCTRTAEAAACLIYFYYVFDVQLRL